MSVVALHTEPTKVKIVAYPWKLPAVEVTPLLKSATVREDASRAGIEVTFDIDDNAGFARRNLAPGSWILFWVMDPATSQWINPPYELYVWDREMTDIYSATSSVTAYDIVSFLQRQGEREWLYRNKTASQIAIAVLNGLGVDYEIVGTAKKIPYLHLSGASPFEVIVAAYTEDRKRPSAAAAPGAGSRYRYRARGRTFVIERLLSQNSTWEISEGSNLLSASWSESLEGMATEVRAVLIDAETRRVVRVAKATSSKKDRYGVIQESIQYGNSKTPAQLSNLAQARLKNVSKLTREATVEAEGIPTIHATDAVIIRDTGTGMKGRFFVSTVSHEFSPEGHTMSLDLSYVAIVPDRPLTETESQEQEIEPEEIVTVGPDGRPVVRSDIAEEYPEEVRDLPTSVTSNTNLVQIPTALSQNGELERIQARFIPIVQELCRRFSVKLSDGFRTPEENARIPNAATCSDHMCGTAADFVGAMSDMIALERYALSMVGIRFGFAIGPEKGDEAHDDHVHISFIRCGCNRAGANGPLLTALYPTPGSTSVPTNDPDAQGTFRPPANSGNVSRAIAAITNGVKGIRMARDIDKFYRSRGSPLAGLGTDFVTIAAPKGVDPRFPVAITACESNAGIYGPAQRAHNPFGMLAGPGRLIQYSSYQDAIVAWVDNIITNTAYNGKRTIAEISTSYAPRGASNDPTNLNVNWVGCVSQYLEELGGDRTQPVKP